MPNLENCVRTAVVEGKNWKQELYKFLKEYRATPHTTTNVSPNEALNGRKLKTTLPEVSQASATGDSEDYGGERRRTEVKDQGLRRLETGHKIKRYKTGRYSACEAAKEKQIKHSFQPRTHCCRGKERIYGYS